LLSRCATDQRKHQVAVLRAAQKVVATDPDWTAWRIEGQGRGWVFLNHANMQSYVIKLGCSAETVGSSG